MPNIQGSHIVQILPRQREVSIQDNWEVDKYIVLGNGQVSPSSLSLSVSHSGFTNPLYEWRKYNSKNGWESINKTSKTISIAPQEEWGNDGFKIGCLVKERDKNGDEGVFAYKPFTRRYLDSVSDDTSSGVDSNIWSKFVSGELSELNIVCSNPNGFKFPEDVGNRLTAGRVSILMHIGWGQNWHPSNWFTNNEIKNADMRVLIPKYVRVFTSDGIEIEGTSVQGNSTHYSYKAKPAWGNGEKGEANSATYEFLFISDGLRRKSYCIWLNRIETRGLEVQERAISDLKKDPDFLSKVSGAGVRENLWRYESSLFKPNLGVAVDNVACTHNGRGVYRITKGSPAYEFYFSEFTDKLQGEKTSKVWICSFRLLGCSRPEVVDFSKLGEKNGRYYIVCNNAKKESELRGTFKLYPFPNMTFQEGDWVEFCDYKVEFVEEGEPLEPTSYIPHVEDLRGADGISPKPIDVAREIDTSVFRGFISDKLAKNQAFILATKGEKGDSADPIRSNLLKGFYGVEIKTLSAMGTNNTHTKIGISRYLEAGKMYAISADVEMMEGSANAITLVLLSGSDIVAEGKTTISGTKTRASFTFSVPAGANLEEVNILGYAGERGKTSGNLARYYNIKLEEVNSDTDKASAYLPHTDDLKVPLSSVVEDLKAQGISNEVKELLKADNNFVLATKGEKGDSADPIRSNLLKGFYGVEIKTLSAMGTNNTHTKIGISRYLEAGKMYAISADVEMMEGSANAITLVLLSGSDIVAEGKTTISGTKTRASFTFSVPAGANLEEVNILGYAGERGKTSGNLARYYNIKLEEVNSDTDKASAYLPHTDDLKVPLSSVVEDLKAQGISNEVKELLKADNNFVLATKGEKGDKGDTPNLSLDSKYRLVADGKLVSAVSLKGDKGERGERGLQGIQGIQGLQGVKGADGVSPSALAVANEINTASFREGLANAVVTDVTTNQDNLAKIRQGMVVETTYNKDKQKTDKRVGDIEMDIAKFAYVEVSTYSSEWKDYTNNEYVGGGHKPDPWGGGGIDGYIRTVHNYELYRSVQNLPPKYIEQSKKVLKDKEYKIGDKFHRDAAASIIYDMQDISSIDVGSARCWEMFTSPYVTSILRYGRNTRMANPNMQGQQKGSGANAYWNVYLEKGANYRIFASNNGSGKIVLYVVKNGVY